MTNSERLTDAKADLQIKSARLEELVNDEESANGLEADAVAERDTLMKEIPAMTAKVQRLSTLEAAQAGLTGGIVYEPTTTAPRPVPIPAQRMRAEFSTVELPKGTIFTRYAMAVAAGKGSLSDSIAYAKRWTNTPEVARYVKTSLEGTALVGSPAWGGELVNPDVAMTEFVDLVRAATILGRIPVPFRTVPFNIPIVTQTGGSTFGWVGEGGVKGVGELAFTRTTLTWSKVAGIIVLTDELIRLSRPDAEATVRQDLVEQCARFIDQQFIQVAISASASNPASVTNGVSSPSASGTTLAAAIHDFNLSLGTFDTANLSTDGLVVVTTPAVARILSSMTNPLGQPPNGFNVSPNGGTLYGYPVVVSASVDAGTLVFMKPSEIFLADDGRVTLDASNQATLDMAGSTTPNFNLWQRNCVGIRAERWIRWQKRNAAAVSVIDTIAYVPGT